MPRPETWTVDDGGELITGTDDDGFFVILFDRRNATERDVRLAAAAPEMRDALRDACAHFALLGSGQTPPDSNAEMCARLSALLARFEL